MYFAGVSPCIVTQAGLKLFILLRLRIKHVYFHTHAFITAATWSFLTASVEKWWMVFPLEVPQPLALGKCVLVYPDGHRASQAVHVDTQVQMREGPAARVP